MRLDEIGRQPCSVAKALAEIGDAWSILILREAFYGRGRFSDFAAYTGAQNTVVSARLKALVGAGILERTVYSEYPTRHHYRLTDKGRELVPVLFTLVEWGDKWVDPDEGRPIDLTHTCGHHIDPVTVCGHCGERLDARDITPSMGPGYPNHLPDPFAAAGD